MLKIIITGGAGFIGSHLTRKLMLENHEVYVIDCLHPYYSLERKKKHLQTIGSLTSEQFTSLDLLNRNETISFFQTISPDAVIHLAAMPGVAYSIENPFEYVDYDIKATINVLEACGQSNARQIIFASSSSVYGNQEGPLKEEMANGNVISPYAASKYSAESFCHVYRHLYGFQTKILRFFTVYGPWVRPDMAIGIFLKKLLNKQAITLYGEDRVRDFTYIDDIVDGIYLALTQLHRSEIINIGSGNPISMLSLLNELKQYFPEMEIRKDDSRAGDVVQTWADIRRAENLLGYSPKVDFGKGLAETVKWAKENEVFL
ncbi:NAD-dependent epimerase/dehydratase family protein [Neobacillus sp. YX16]|uniref:NAD-dependent epimerase/dehydratase family protein n=1 Tax=Neobacillus sp. YX16 TaxID=3047874 RepID=UPI0024C309F1|nr:NAD-dependent epimerase/dehydratase family protein [Neobacillus sp. YX16]WHZ02288.1 NAD-dependent epimerase/dehydratase family protein [Neobacillus sp. YX16]